MGLHQTTKVLNIKESKRMKRSPFERGKIFTNNVSDKGLIFKIYKELSVKQPDLKKWADVLNTFFQRRQMMNRLMTRCSISLIRKMQINHNGISLCTCQNGYHKKTTNTMCQQGCGDKGLLLHCWWDCNTVVEYCGNKICSSSKNYN